MNRSFIILTLATLASLTAPVAAAAVKALLQDDVRSRCYDILVAALEDPSPWIRVHAAEALIAMKRPELALVAFRPKSETTEPKYRIVVWRVLAGAEPDAAKKRQYVERIRAALLDPNGPDHAHAMEALAKLREPAASNAEQKKIREVADGKGPIAPFAIWRLALAGDPAAIDQLVALLRSDDAIARARAAYVLSRIKPLPDPVHVAIANTLKTEPADSPAVIMLRTAAGDDAVRELARDTKVAPSGRYFAAMSLADSGSADDLPILRGLLDDADSDVRVGAAFALLQIESRGPTTTPAAR